MSDPHICEGTNDYDSGCVDGRVILCSDPYGDIVSFDAGPCRCPCHRDLEDAASEIAAKESGGCAAT